MSIMGVLWVIGIVLKAFGLALVSTSWVLVILWPVLVTLILWVIIAVFGVSIAGFSALRR